jgi:hypothetical protein
MIAIPKAVLDVLGLERLRALELTNSICLEEAIQLYPYLEKQWDTTEADSRAMLALILQYKQSFPIAVGVAHAEQAATLGLTLKPELETPAPLIFISQYFVHSKAKRAKEIGEVVELVLLIVLVSLVITLVAWGTMEYVDFMRR